MAGSPSELGVNGLEHSNFRAPHLFPVNTIEQPTPAEVLYLPHPLDNPIARERILKNGPDPEKDPEGAAKHYDAVATVFDDEGRWLLRGAEGTYPNFWNSQPALVVQAMVHELRSGYDLVDHNLRGEKWPHGFNRHDLEHHVFEVLDKSRALLKQAGFDKSPDILRINAVAAIGHDIGNISDRVNHADLSPQIVATVIPDIVNSPRDWEMAKQAMELHDEKKLLAYLEGTGARTEDEKIMQLRKLNNPVLLALVIADKVGSIGRHRTNPWARTPNTVNEDTHMWTNYLARGGNIEVSHFGRELTAIVNFNPTISDEEIKEFPDLAILRDNHDGFKAMVPQEIEDIRHEHKIPDFLTWAGNITGIYRERTKLAALCAKALFPRLQKFSLELRDRPVPGSEGGLRVGEDICFDDYLDQQYAAIDMIHRTPESNKSGYTQTEFALETEEETNISTAIDTH